MAEPTEAHSVLLVSKPPEPPWTDGSSVLARDLVRFARNTRYVPTGGGRRWRARALWALTRRGGPPLVHTFFAPNPRTNRIFEAALRARRRPVIHTVCSHPTGGVRTWFADVHVALSHDTAAALRAAGAPNVRVIRAGIAPTPPIGQADRAALGLPQGPLVLFAGDLRAGGGADLLADALLECPTVRGVFACRPKGAEHRQREARLRARLGDRALWLGVVDDMPRLVASCDVQCLPATDLTAKVDTPLVLLEGLRAGRPVIVADTPPTNELVGPGVVHTRPRAADVAHALRAVLEAPPTASLPPAHDARATAAAYESIYEELS